MDQDDLDPAALAPAPDDPTAGPDHRLGHDQTPRRVERSSQALGHRALRLTSTPGDTRFQVVLPLTQNG